MKSIEAKLTSLRAKISSNQQPLYREITQISEQILTNQLNQEKESELKSLCELHSILNSTETKLNSESNIAYFNRIKNRKEVEELNLEIINRIRQILIDKYNPKLEKKDEENKPKKTGLFLFSVFIASVFAATNGISILQSVITTFISLSSIPNAILIPVEIAFAGLGVLAFYALELHSIGKPLGIRTFEMGSVFKLYGNQAVAYQETFWALHQALLAKDLSRSDHTFLKETSGRLNSIYKSFQTKVSDAKTEYEKPSRKKVVLRGAFTVISAVVCGILGSLAGPSFASTFIMPIVVGALGASAATGPIGLGITIATMVVFFAIAAGLYVLIQQKATDKVVNRFAGTPTKAVTQIKDSESNTQEYQQNINSLIALKDESLTSKERAPYNTHIHQSTPAPKKDPYYSAWVNQKTGAPHSPVSNHSNLLLNGKPQLPGPKPNYQPPGEPEIPTHDQAPGV